MTEPRPPFRQDYPEAEHLRKSQRQFRDAAVDQVDGHEVEAANCATGEWEDAVIQGFAVWRVIERNLGSVLLLDLDQRTIIGLPPE